MSYIQQDDENGEKTNEDPREIIVIYHLGSLKRKQLRLEHHVQEQDEK